MNQTLQGTMGATVVLKKACVRCHGLSLRYSLAAVQTCDGVRYDAAVERGDEKQSVTLGNDVEEALRLFEMLWRGSVTPCVLKETVADLHTAAFLDEKSLQSL